MDELRIRIFKAALPEGVNGLSCPDGNGYLIAVNSKVDELEQIAIIFHEVLHIWHDDFKNDRPVQEIEAQRHKELERILETVTGKNIF